MKISVSSYSFSQYRKNTGASLFALCDLAKEIGFSGIEFIDLSTYAESGDAPDLAVQTRAHCAAIGLPIVAYTVGADFIKRGVFEEAERLKHCVDIAALLGADVMRHDATYETGGDWRKTIEKIAPGIREVAAYAQSRGVRTCTENHGFAIQDANRVEALILAVNHKNYGWLVDIGNFACADQLSVPAVEIAAPYAFHAHVKDFLIKPDTENPGAGWFSSRHGQYLRGTVAGHGAIPIKACVKILQKHGYDGFLSYEFEGMEENIPALSAGLSYLRSVLESLG